MTREISLLRLSPGLTPPHAGLRRFSLSCDTDVTRDGFHTASRPAQPWRARYRAPDGRQISKSFRRKVDAERWLLLEEGDVLAGRWHDPASGTELFSRYCEKWLVGRRPTVAGKTDYNTETLVRGRIIPAFGDKELRQITTAGVRDWQTGLLAEGLSPATVRTYRQILGQVLRQAVADGLISTNPVEGVRAPTVRPRRQLFLTADELKRLADAAAGYGPLVWFLGWSVSVSVRRQPCEWETSTSADDASGWRSRLPRWAAGWNSVLPRLTSPARSLSLDS